MHTIFGSENPGSIYYFRIWKPWKCIPFSDLNTLEVYTTFRSENLGSAYHYFRIWKPWKCILFSDLKTVEVCTNVGSENLGGVYYLRTRYSRRRFGGVWGGEALPARRRVWWAARPPVISAVNAGLEFTSRLNCLTAGLQFKLGLPGYENIFTSGFWFKLGLPGYVFSGYFPVTIHWPGGGLSHGIADYHDAWPTITDPKMPSLQLPQLAERQNRVFEFLLNEQCVCNHPPWLWYVMALVE